jgi:hypothetical protein
MDWGTLSASGANEIVSADIAYGSQNGPGDLMFRLHAGAAGHGDPGEVVAEAPLLGLPSTGSSQSSFAIVTVLFPEPVLLPDGPIGYSFQSINGTSCGALTVGPPTAAGVEDWLDWYDPDLNYIQTYSPHSFFNESFYLVLTGQEDSSIPGQILVPSEVADLQVAIGSAQPGDVILVDGGVWPEILIDRPITIQGVEGNRPVFGYPSATILNQPADVITLAGPGSGLVQLINLDVSIVVSTLYSPAATGPRCITGGGFDELRVLHCNIGAGMNINVNDPQTTASPAIDVDIPYMLVGDSSVVGQEVFSAGIWQHAPPSDWPDGGAGVVTTGDAVVVESVVRGGPVEPFGNGCAVGCPPVASGGDGVIASTLYRSDDAVIEGGGGASTGCCPMRAGVDIVAGSDEVLPGTLRGDGPASLGGIFTLEADVTGPVFYLALSGFPIAPLQIGNKGLLFMDPSSIFLFGLAGSGTVQIPVNVTPDPIFLGIPVVFQAYDPPIHELSNPIYTSHIGP